MLGWIVRQKLQNIEAYSDRRLVSALTRARTGAHEDQRRPWNIGGRYQQQQYQQCAVWLRLSLTNDHRIVTWFPAS